MQGENVRREAISNALQILPWPQRARTERVTESDINSTTTAFGGPLFCLWRLAAFGVPLAQQHDEKFTLRLLPFSKQFPRSLYDKTTLIFPGSQARAGVRAADNPVMLCLYTLLTNPASSSARLAQPMQFQCKS